MSLVIRLPAPLHAALKALAADEERSLNNMMVRLLREGVARREATEETAAD